MLDVSAPRCCAQSDYINKNEKKKTAIHIASEIQNAWLLLFHLYAWQNGLPNIDAEHNRKTRARIPIFCARRSTHNNNKIGTFEFLLLFSWAVPRRRCLPFCMCARARVHKCKRERERERFLVGHASQFCAHAKPVDSILAALRRHIIEHNAKIEEVEFFILSFFHRFSFFFAMRTAEKKRVGAKSLQERWATIRMCMCTCLA